MENVGDGATLTSENYDKIMSKKKLALHVEGEYILLYSIIGAAKQSMWREIPVLKTQSRRKAEEKPIKAAVRRQVLCHII